MQPAVCAARIKPKVPVFCSGVQTLIIKCLPAEALCLWFVQLHAYTGNRDELVFLFLFIYNLLRFIYHKDFHLQTLFFK